MPAGQTGQLAFEFGGVQKSRHVASLAESRRVSYAAGSGREPRPDLTGRQLVVGAAIIRDGRLLAARRVEPPELAGGWELPGGKVEPGEDDHTALVREIAEELRVHIQPGARIGGDWLPGDTYVLHVYLARLAVGAQPLPAEQHDAIQWVGLADFDAVAWLPGDVEPARTALRAAT